MNARFFPDRGLVRVVFGVISGPDYEPLDRHVRGSDDREDFNGVGMLKGTWSIAEGIDLNAEAAYFSVLNDVPEFRATALSEIKIAIGVVEGLSFKLGGSYEYDSQNVESNDRKYYGNLVYDF